MSGPGEPIMICTDDMRLRFMGSVPWQVDKLINFRTGISFVSPIFHIGVCRSVHVGCFAGLAVLFVAVSRLGVRDGGGHFHILVFTMVVTVVRWVLTTW